jgi:putative flippase GtrA
MYEFKTFGKSQLTALAATAVDFSVLYFFASILHLYYVFAVALGALTGGGTNFLLNRKWAFSSGGKLATESIRYILVSLASMGLNVLFVFLLTELLGWFYLISKIATAVAVGFLWNYPLHRYWVFKGKEYA